VKVLVWVSRKLCPSSHTRTDRRPVAGRTQLCDRPIGCWAWHAPPPRTTSAVCRLSDPARKHGSKDSRKVCP